MNSLFNPSAGRQIYVKEEMTSGRFSSGQSANRDALLQKISTGRWGKAIPYKELPSSLPVARLVSHDDVEVTLDLDEPLSRDVKGAGNVVREVRMQIPPEMFDLSKLVCGTYVDPRLLVLRGVSGSALLFTRSCADESFKQ